MISKADDSGNDEEANTKCREMDAFRWQFVHLCNKSPIGKCNMLINDNALLKCRIKANSFDEISNKVNNR